MVVSPSREDFRDDEAGVLYPLTPLMTVHLLRVTRQIDAGVSGFCGGLYYYIGFFEDVVADPRKRVALQAVFESHDVRLSALEWRLVKLSLGVRFCREWSDCLFKMEQISYVANIELWTMCYTKSLEEKWFSATA